MSLKITKAVDLHTAKQISAYITRCSIDCSIDIPDIIQSLILLFYWINEKLTDHGDDINIYKGTIENTMIIRRDKHVGNGYNTFYGKQIIDFKDTSIKAYKWTFYIKKIKFFLSQPALIYFGIDSSDNKWTNSLFAKGNGYKYYAVSSNGKIRCTEDTNRKIMGWSDIREGDEFSLILYFDGVIAKLYCQLNDDQQKLISWISDTSRKRYNMAVSLPKVVRNQEIQLVYFKIFQ